MSTNELVRFDLDVRLGSMKESLIFRIKKKVFKMYLLIPGNSLLFRLFRRISIPPRNIRTYLRFQGTFTLKLDSTRSIELKHYGNTIENELFWRGINGWEPRSLGVWMRLAQQSEVIIDVGANTGLYSVIARKVNAKAVIYAFEPLPWIFERMQQNLLLNSMTINACQLALGNTDGPGTIFAAKTISDTFDQASLNRSQHKAANVEEYTIQKQRLSTFIEQHHLKLIDLIKIDVESFEPFVLEGFGKYLEATRPTILIEILSHDTATKIHHIVEHLGYVWYRIEELSGIIKVRDLSPGPRGNNFLLVNEEKHPMDFSSQIPLDL